VGGLYQDGAHKALPQFGQSRLADRRDRRVLRFTLEARGSSENEDHLYDNVGYGKRRRGREWRLLLRDPLLRSWVCENERNEGGIGRGHVWHCKIIVFMGIVVVVVGFVVAERPHDERRRGEHPATWEQ
jgi:hypothetical protein